jgi:hypothetical protein
MEKERIRKYFLSCGDLLNSGVVGAISPRCWGPLLAPLLIHCWRHGSSEFPCLTVRQPLVKWPVFPQLKHE